MKKFIFFFQANPKDRDRIKNIVAEHTTYWHSFKAKTLETGKFADKSGGLIVFMEESMESAEKVVENDPFVLKQLIELKFVKEWESKKTE